ncbi:MAG: Stage V sporulation protein E / Cell division protein FtsW [uncultured Phycisphaerae bacterium]|uniref:Probable peptidoglycan glycosyltransferase FtsW n=1 Tax=uncultured Phycisphaerae bacterium TaxID=904963 RepID=A0A6J4QIV1_9BACT|nr:MAG: Stage V sporulation protein E / Cell division protein FtsW [uncultured Phycisphaerae bacterium]
MDSSIYRMRPRDVLTVCVLALLALGTVMVQSASTTLGGSIVKAPPPDPGGPKESSPARPVNVQAAASADGIDVSWSPDRDPAVVSYRVYRGPPAGSATGADGEFELLETLRKPRSRFHDPAAPQGEPSAYRVTAVDDAGTESAPTELTVTRPGLWRWTPLASKHLVYVGLAVGLYVVVGRLDYHRLAPPDAPLVGSPVFWLLTAATLLCVGVLVPGIGTAINGARRWIKLGPVQIQPSELAKWAAVVFTACWLTRPGADERGFFRGFVLGLLPVGGLCLLVVIQDFGTAVLIGACALTMLLAGRAKWWHVAVLLVPAVAAAYWFVAAKEYRLRRIMAFRDPYASPQGEGYHMIQSLLSFTTGGVTGRGLGNGVQKLGYLPEDTTDFIFAVICEELGLFGAMLVVVLYLGIVFVTWETIRRKRDDFGRLLAFGVASMVGLQAAINIAVATVSVPTKGLSLPLISAGGSGMVITSAALGLLYSVTRFGVARSRRQEAGSKKEDGEDEAPPLGAGPSVRAAATAAA